MMQALARMAPIPKIQANRKSVQPSQMDNAATLSIFQTNRAAYARYRIFSGYAAAFVGLTTQANVWCPELCSLLPYFHVSTCARHSALRPIESACLPTLYA